jgi:hypothetical protein
LPCTRVRVCERRKRKESSMLRFDVYILVSGLAEHRLGPVDRLRAEAIPKQYNLLGKRRAR